MPPSLEQWPVIGQDRVLRFLDSTLAHGTPASAYLFHGPNLVGKRTTARHFLATLLCQQSSSGPCGTCDACVARSRGLHPDYVIVDKEGQSIGIEQVRNLQHQLSRRASLDGYRVALINEAEALTIEASNALLKTLEEPPERTVIVLCSSSLGQLPLTLRSRCQQLSFQLLPQAMIEELLLRHTNDPNLARDLSHVAVGRPGIALQLLQNREEYAQYQDRVTRLLDIMEEPLAQRLRSVGQLLPRGTAHTMRSTAWPLLDLWVWLLRDAVLVRERSERFLVHRFLTERIRVLAERYTSHQLLQFIQRLRTLRELLSRNINPTLVLEDFVLHV